MGDPGFEWRVAGAAFMQTVGTWINGYAFVKPSHAGAQPTGPMRSSRICRASKECTPQGTLDTIGRVILKGVRSHPSTAPSLRMRPMRLANLNACPAPPPPLAFG